MRADRFLRLAKEALPELVRRYHLAEWWIDVNREALKGWDQAKALVMAALEDAEEPTRRMVERAFRRAHELYRGALGRLLKAGNNCERWSDAKGAGSFGRFGASVRLECGSGRGVGPGRPQVLRGPLPRLPLG